MSRSQSSSDDSELASGERLQKVMAAAGVASRRVSEDMIAAGRVTVNGKVVTEPGRRIDPAKDKIVVDGSAVQLDATRRYVMLNKPVGIVSTLSDENGRPDRAVRRAPLQRRPPRRRDERPARPDQRR
jgi:16S rRNA U516 pseudouridylate synthase RsuA-like enzyme